MPLNLENLRLHVGARASVSNCINKGWVSSRKVLSVFGEDPSAPVLDWGCDCGRTLRHLLYYPAWREHYRGTDVDAEAIEWLRGQGIGSVRTCPADRVSLPYADGEFGGIFSFSVLTHIHPTKFRTWFAELARILAPGGLAYLTFNGDSLIDAKKPEHASAARDFERQGWAWMEHPGHYTSGAFASYGYVREAADGIFEIEKIEPRDYAQMSAIFARRTR